MQSTPEKTVSAPINPHARALVSIVCSDCGHEFAKMVSFQLEVVQCPDCGAAQCGHAMQAAWFHRVVQ
jgi:ribosomal protein S27E